MQEEQWNGGVRNGLAFEIDDTRVNEYQNCPTASNDLSCIVLRSYAWREVDGSGLGDACPSSSFASV